MAGVSLKCGDYGALLKSVEEAQEHAELTSHSNCPKSTKAVLNLVCTACGKPCRSKTESDLHTKQTGHTDFVDKTEEAAKPISLEVPKAAVETDEVLVEATGNGQSEEMVVSEVDQNLLEELEGISFPKARATRALHFSAWTLPKAPVDLLVSALLMLRCSLISEKKKSSIDVDFFTEYGEGSRYRIEEVIGKESYGVGCSAYDAHTGEKVAIKKINDIFEHVSDATHVLREIKLLRLLRHPDIVEFKHIFVASL